VQLVGEEIETLRRRGHVTDRAVPVVRTSGGELLVILEWSTDHAVEDAHADPEVLAVWDRKAVLAEYIAPRDLTGSEVPFASFPIVADFPRQLLLLRDASAATR
jgi:hypothetical protein